MIGREVCGVWPCYGYDVRGAGATRGNIAPSLTRLCRVKTCHGGGSGSRSPPDVSSVTVHNSPPIQVGFRVGPTEWKPKQGKVNRPAPLNKSTLSVPYVHAYVESALQ